MSRKPLLRRAGPTNAAGATRSLGRHLLQTANYAGLASSGAPDAKFIQDVQLEHLKFVHTLINTILAQLVIGAVVLFLGLWANRLLERYKAREAYIASFTQNHVNKVAEIWQMAYEWESFIEEGKPPDPFAEEEKWRLFLDRMQSRIAHSEWLAENFRKAVEGNRFWLGQRLYKRLVEYHNLLGPYMAALALRNIVQLKSLKSQLDSQKADIMSVIHSDPLRTRG